MFRVREFERWRNAPSDQRPDIAWDQAARHGIATLFPILGNDPTNILGLKAGYEKVFSDWRPDELQLFIDWVRALKSAARDQLEMLELQDDSPRDYKI